MNIPPDRMLLIFLPLLLTEAAFFTSFRDFKANLRPILQLAIGLVIFTSITTALLFHSLIPGSDWAVGMVLGAIISPPDAVARHRHRAADHHAAPHQDDTGRRKPD